MKTKSKMVFTIIISFALVVTLITLGYKTFYTSTYLNQYSAFVQESAQKYDVDPALIHAIIKAESGYNEKSKSHAGAYGLMQLTKETFYDLQNIRNEEGKNIFDPQTNIDYGTHYISILLKKYQNDTLALCAYNAGPTNVDRWLANQTISYDSESSAAIPFRETKLYVNKVSKYRQKYKSLYFNKNS